MKISKENYIDKLKDLNADGIKPAFIAAEAECLLRENQITPSLPEKEAMKYSPGKEKSYFDEEILPLKDWIAEP